MSTALYVSLGILVGTLAYYLRLPKDANIPTVTPMMPWLGDMWPYLKDSMRYITKCQERYGTVFRIILGPRHIVVVCDPEGINAILRDKPHSLSARSNHIDMALAMGNVTGDVEHVLNDRLIPVTTHVFTLQSIPVILPTFSRCLHEKIMALALRSTESPVPLVHFVGQALYEAMSIAFFGRHFPLSTYHDFEELDLAVPILFWRIPFAKRAAKRARTRLHDQIGAYIDRALQDDTVEYTSELAAQILHVLQDLGLPPADRNGMLLVFIWGMYSNLMRMAFWLTAHLLSDPQAFTRIREEIDQTLSEKFPDISSLYNATPSELDNPSFKLLDSAVKETIRVMFWSPSLRNVDADMDITLSTGRSISLRKGEYVLANPRAVHEDPQVYEDALAFRFDRFASTPDAYGKASPPLWLWGSGTHICRGRFFATHAIKMLIILCVRNLNITAVTASGRPLPRSPSPIIDVTSSLWRMAAPEDILVQCKVRH